MPPRVEHPSAVRPARWRAGATGFQAVLLAGRLCRHLMVLVLSLLIALITLGLCVMLLQLVPALRLRDQLSAAEREQQRLRQELSSRTVRFTPDGRILLDSSNYSAKRRSLCDPEIRQVWEGTYEQAPPFELIEFAQRPWRLDTGGISWGGVSRDHAPFPPSFGRRPMFLLPGGSVPADTAPPSSIVWRYDPYGQIWERYDSYGRWLGALGSAGFAEDPRATVPLGPVVVGFADSDRDGQGLPTRAFWITTRHVYHLDFAVPAAEIVLDGESLRQVSLGSLSQTSRVRCQVVTAEGVHHLWLRNPREYRRLAIHTTNGEPVIGEAGVDLQGRTYVAQVVAPRRQRTLAEDQSACCSATLYRVGTDGLAEEVSRHVWDLPVYQPRSRPSFALIEWPEALIPALLYAVPSRWLGERPDLYFGGPAVALLTGSAWLLLGIALARRRGESRVAVAAWAPVVLGFNLAGFLAWRLCAEGTVRTCAACGHRTAAHRQTCRHCGRDPAPEQELISGSLGCPRVTQAASQQCPNVAAGPGCPVPPAAAPTQRRPPADRPAVAGPERGQTPDQKRGSAWELRPILEQPERHGTGPAGMRMAATIRRELCQFRPLLTFLAVAFAVTAALYRAELASGSWPQRLLSYSTLWYGRHGLLHAWGVVFCLGCLALGLLNGLSQFALRSHGEWAFLLHRPDSRLRLLTGVLAGGLLATAAFPGVLWTVLWGLARDVSGEFGAPLRHLAEGWVFTLWGALVYLGTTLCCLDPQSGLLGRLLGPALAAVAVLYGLFGSPSLAWSLLTVAVTCTLLLVQVYDGFARREF
jgi:hypothetical protein